ncbi:oligosaccharide flippase family protein [Chloroflexota bacterium]
MFNQLFRLSKHTIIYGLGAAASYIVSFFLIPVYTRYLTPDDYGILAIFTASMPFAGVLLGLGLASALLRFYFNYNEEKERKEAISSVLLFLTVISFLFLLALIPARKQISLLIFGSDQYASSFLYISLIVVCDIGNTVAFVVLRAREESKKYVAFFLAQCTVDAGLKVYFLVVLHRGVPGILEAQLISVSFLYLILVGSIIRGTGLKLSLTKLKAMLRFGLPLVPAGISTSVMLLSDRYLLQFLSTSHELGLYSLGCNLGGVIQALLITPFITAWFPFMFDIAKEKNARQIYSSVLTYFVLVGMFGVLVISVLSQDFMRIMATPAFYDAYKVVPMLVFSRLLTGCYAVFAAGVYLENKTKYMPIIVGASALLNLGMNYLLIPSYGMMGAAAASVLSTLFMVIAMFFVSERLYPIKYDFGRVLKVFLSAILIYIASLYITNDSAVIEGVLKALTLLTYPALLYLFKFYRPEEIQKGREVLRSAVKYIKAKFTREHPANLER